MLEDIRKRMESCTDTYVENAEFLDDMNTLLSLIDKYKEALEEISSPSTPLHHNRITAREALEKDQKNRSDH